MPGKEERRCFDRERIQAQLWSVYERGLFQADPYWNFGFPKLTAAVPELKSGLFFIAAPENVGKCYTGDMLLADGSYKPVSEAEPGDMVLTLGPTSLEPRQVLHKVCSGTKPTFRVTLHDGSQVTVTTEHPFLTRRGWQPLGDLVVGDPVGVPNGLPCGREGRPAKELRLLGYLLGDGGVGDGNVYFTNQNPEIVADFTDCLPEGYELVPHDPQRRPHMYRVRSTQGVDRRGMGVKGALRLWCEEVNLWGHHAWDKVLPPFAYRLDEAGTIELLRGLFATDAHVPDRRRVEYDSTSEALARGVKRLLLRLGIRARITHRSHPRGKDSYRLYIGSKGSQIDRLWAQLRVPGKSQGEHPCVQWLPITAIQPLGEQPVFDIEVEGTHNFIGGDDIFLHNSMLLLNMGYNVLLHNPEALWIDFTLDDSVEKRIGYLMARVGEIPIANIHRAANLDEGQLAQRKRAFSRFLKVHGDRYHLDGFSALDSDLSVRYTAEYIASYVAGARAQCPDAKLLVTVDGFHDISLAARFQDENDRQRQKTEVLKAAASKSNCLFLMSAQCRKDSRRRGMSPDVVKGDDTVLYAADVIAHLYSDLNLNRDQALVCWYDDSQPDRRLPVHEVDILKNKAGGFKGVLFYNYLPERAWDWEADDVSQDMYRSYLLSQASKD